MIIVRYLTRQILLTTAALTFILLVVAVLGRLLQYLAQASQGELDPGVLVLLMGYRLPDFLQLILPLALLLGILLAYGRMYADSEMTVLIACGLSRRRLLGITQMSGAGIALLVAFLAFYLTPSGLVNTATLLEAQKNLSEFDLLVPGLFQNIARGERTTYAEDITDNDMHRVFMHEAAGNRVIFAEVATSIEDETGERFVLFRNGTLTEGLAGSEEFAMTSFDELGVRLPQRVINFDVALEEQALSSRLLLEAGESVHLAELQWRISLVLLIPVLVLLAVPLSRVTPREGRFARLVPAIFLYIAYFGLLLICRDLVKAERLPPAIGLWWVHLLFAVLGWGLMTGRLARLPGFRALGRHG
jgi:lipopolysaccharide export system permease protein